MSKPIHVLILEDNPLAAEMNVRELRRAGFEPQWKRVESEADFLTELDKSPDLILADYSLPHFDGLKAVKLLRARGHDIPFILISGTIGEEAAVEVIHHGATDFMLKDRIVRLGSAVERALSERQLRAERNQADEVLRQRSEELRIQNETLSRFNRVAVGRELRMIELKREVNELCIKLGDPPRRKTVELELALAPFTGVTQAQLATLNLMEDTMTARDRLNIANLELRGEIIERKKAEAERTRLTHHMEVLLETTDEGICGVDLEGRVTFINRAGAEMLGWGEDEIIGQNVHETLHHHKRDGSPYPKEECPLLRSIRSGEGIREDGEVFWKKDATSFSVEYSSHPIRKKGVLNGAVVTFSDITERKDTEEELLASEVRYRRLFESAKDGILILDADTGIIVDVNPFLMELLNYPRTHFVGRQLWEIGCFTDISANKAAFRKLMEEKFIRYDDLPLITKGGKSIWVEFVSNLYDVNGKQVIQCNIRDVTERKRAESALHRVAAIVEFSHDAIISKDLRGIITSWNRGAEKIFGYSSREMVGTSILRLIPADRQDEEIQILTKIERGESVEHFDTLRQTKDGRPINVSITASPIKDVNGNICGISKVARDITDRKKAELALQESEERFRQLAENINEVFFVIDPHPHQLLYISPAYENIWGRTCESAYKSPNSWMDAIHPDDREQVRQAVKTKMSRGDYGETFRIQRPDGSVRWIRYRAYPIRDAAGEVYRIVGTAMDITENRELDHQLQQSQKMEAFGLLAGGIAHDFNNLMSVVMGYSDIWLMKLSPDAPICGPLKAIRNAGERASDLTKQLLAFSRKTVMEPKILDINTVIRETEKMLKRLIGEDIQFSSVLNPAISRIKIDPGQLGQVLMNLAVNARDAMPRGGGLSIETRMVEFDAAYVFSHPGAQLGRQVMLSVSDTGNGMPPEIVARIFEPFFTTKGVGKGTGLGLAVVYGIVTQSGGSIQVESKADVGTTFKLYFPATLDAVQATDKSDDLLSFSGIETILVVEDEDSLRDITAESLQSFGYTVLTASAGPAALECVHNSLRTIDLMLTDVVMPGMNGRELADTLKPELPKLKVLYMSGYMDDSVLRNGVNQKKVAFLQKPFAPFDLLKKVREVLDKN